MKTRTNRTKPQCVQKKAVFAICTELGLALAKSWLNAELIGGRLVPKPTGA